MDVSRFVARATRQQRVRRSEIFLEDLPGRERAMAYAVMSTVLPVPDEPPLSADDDDEFADVEGLMPPP
jgi:hypothetical protein